VHCRNSARARASKLAAARRRDYGSRRSRVARQLKLLVGAGVVAAVGAQSAAAAGWSIQPVPLPQRPASTELTGVSCPSTDDCIAVGVADLNATGNYIPLVEHWNGASWSIERTPIPPLDEGGGALSSVSCTSSSACMAAGSFGPGDGPLAERWNGSSWSLQRPPDPVGAYGFDGISCASSTDCIAVGGGDKPLAERWDGRRWSVQTTHFSDALSSGLLGVSCPSSTACAAVGADDVGLCSDSYDYGSGYSDYYLEVFGLWKAGRWSIRPHPNIACSRSGDEGGGNGMAAVSCTSPTACTAVGSEIYRWNGSHWTVQPEVVPTDVLLGVSCSASDECTAVGSGIDTWDGHDWWSVPMASPAHASATTLNSVSCVSPDTCVAVGTYANRADQNFPLAESIGISAAQER